jgi:hypothetical protein
VVTQARNVILAELSQKTDVRLKQGNYREILEDAWQSPRSDINMAGQQNFLESTTQRTLS